ncbi:hypothetical protein FNJ88_13035 [Chryseobacterium sp. SNU WT5]|uniref:hypothetical protein n=1 Tax=Chryseobacterium sp. SNU WT5 TaxID=2594269 RepID=UPI00117EDCDC|nr:hypothetical protein [Chryseobacterium sp. SNU WT5]QDP86433.1 hypothetical protein FNJ88_13035 [Chryseobacterium sp. SNU WT5]
MRKVNKIPVKLVFWQREASVKLLDSINNYYKIAANNGDIGFILKQKLTKSMRGKKDADEPKDYFYRGTAGTQCPHLYVQVSGLRARTEPNTTSSVSQILPINKFECIEYLPISKNGWVYIGDYFHKNPAFVQYKYLGDEISFKETLVQFEKTKPVDINQKKILLERLVEIGWNSDPQNTLKALKLFKTFHQNQGTLESVPEIDFELFLAEHIQNPLSPKARSEFNYNKITVNINGTELNDGTITEAQMKSLNLIRINDYSTLPNFSECGWDPGFAYVNKSKKTIINFEENNNKITGLVESLSFIEGNSMVINGFRIDHNTLETDFIKKFGKLISFNRFNFPGTYYLPDGDAGFMEISFKNGKAFSYQHSFYC